MKRHSRKWIFGSKPIVRDKHSRSGSRCNMPDKMAVCFGGAKVKTNHRADGRSPRLTANPPDVPKVPVRRRGCLLRMSRRRVAIRSPCCPEPLLRSSQEAYRANLCFHLGMWRMRLQWLSSIRFSQFQKGVLLDMANSILETISSEFASAAEKVGSSVVAVHARRWMPTSGIEWKEGVVVTVTLFPKPTSRLRPL